MKILLKVFALLALATLACVLAAGWILGRPVQETVGSPPAELNAQSVSFPANSGATVRGWFCAASNSRGTILLLPGIRANRLSMLGRARFLERARYSVLLIDFQATGETKGEQITFGWRESQDVLAAIQFIRNKRPLDRVGVIGSSLGGAAVLLATPSPKIDGLVIEAVYPTIEIATRNRLENYLGPVGRAVAPLLLAQLKPRTGIRVSDLRPVDHIARISCPILIINGEKDRHTRSEDAMLLYSNTRSPKELWFIPEATHVDLHSFAKAEYEARALAFFQRTIANPSLD